MRKCWFSSFWKHRFSSNFDHSLRLNKFIIFIDIQCIYLFAKTTVFFWFESYFSYCWLLNSFYQHRDCDNRLMFFLPFPTKHVCVTNWVFDKIELQHTLNSWYHLHRIFPLKLSQKTYIQNERKCNADNTRVQIEWFGGKSLKCTIFWGFLYPYSCKLLQAMYI